MPRYAMPKRVWVHPPDDSQGHWEELGAPLGTLPPGRSALSSQWAALRHPPDVAARNRRNVTIDAVGVGIAAGIGTFLSVFLVRLGASDFMVGLLTAMPALTGMLLAIPIGNFLAGRRQIVPWFSLARLMVISCYALTGLVPFFARDTAPVIIVGIWAVATLPQTVVSVAFTVVMGQVAGPRGRVSLMAQRWSILGLANALAILGAGLILERVGFPINYQIIFVLSAIGGLISFLFSSRITLPDQAPPARPASAYAASPWRRDLHVLRRSPQFVRFTFSQFLFRAGLTMALPLLPIYWVRQANASDAWISIINTAQTVALLVAYIAWTRITRRRGERFALLLCAFGGSLYPLLTALARTPLPLPFFAAINGVFQAGINLVFFDILLHTCPPGEQARYIGINQTTTYVATFVSPIVGTYLAQTYSIEAGLLLSGILSLVGALLFYLLRVGRQSYDEPPPTVVEA